MLLHEFKSEIKNMGLHPVTAAKIIKLADKIDLYAKTTSPVDLNEILKEVSIKTGISQKCIKEKIRDEEVLSARVLFIRSVLSINPAYDLRAIGLFLNKDRTTIFHSAYKCKVKCDIPPLSIYKKKKLHVHLYQRDGLLKN